MIELLKDVAGTLLRHLKNQALRFFNIEGGDVHRGVTRADLNYVVASPHALTFLVEDDSVLVKNTGLSIDHSTRLSEFLHRGPRRRQCSNRRLAHHRGLNAVLIARVVLRCTRQSLFSA